ncbi:MAG: hypothetical protein AB2L14_22755 [Candidatus Xenobiia bacterium LiM19]
MEGEIKHFYGEVVTNTWTWLFQNKTAKGKVILILRFIDSKDGKIIIETKGESESRVAGGPDKVNGELNSAFKKAMSMLFQKKCSRRLQRYTIDNKVVTGGAAPCVATDYHRCTCCCICWNREDFSS